MSAVGGAKESAHAQSFPQHPRCGQTVALCSVHRQMEGPRPPSQKSAVDCVITMWVLPRWREKDGLGPGHCINKGAEYQNFHF